MKVKARFIGTNKSMGFIHNRIYNLKTECKNLVVGPCICIYDTKGHAWCPYRSIETFLDNWEILGGKSKNERARSK